MKHTYKQMAFCLSLVMMATVLLTSCKHNQEPIGQTTYDTAPIASAATDTESRKNTDTPLNLLEITLPEEMERQRISDSQESIISNTKTVGGIFLLECDDAIFDDVLGYTKSLEPVVAKAMEDIGIPKMDWLMEYSSPYALCEFNMGNEQSEYIVYVLRGKSACYAVWADRKQIPYETEKAIMESLHSEDITEELNKVSTEAYMDAISESLALGDYHFEVDLPDGITSTNTSSEGALFYQDGRVIGGYKVIHFEKGILPAVHDNKEMILDRLKESVMDQIDMTDFSAEITDEELITAVFSNGDKEYTHYILSYGQIGTQYDLWFDTLLLDQHTVNSIMWGAKLVN